MESEETETVGTAVQRIEIGQPPNSGASSKTSRGTKTTRGSRTSGALTSRGSARGSNSTEAVPLIPAFLAGPENRALAFVCQQRPPLSEQDNPLLLIGASGAGKTTLARFIANAQAESLSRPKIVFITAVEFARRYAEAVDGDTLDHFRRPFDTADILVLDDAHFIADKPAAQQELATRLSTRYDASLSTIITSRRSPAEIKGIRPILASRMLPGLLLNVVLPGEETRKALLIELCRQEALEIDNTSIHLLANTLPKSIPATRLAAAVQQLRIHCRKAGKPVDIEAIQHAIDNTPSGPELSINEIASAVAKRFKLKTIDLKGATRRQQVVRARAMAMLLARQLTDLSLQQIGAFFGGRDHTTVLHACRKTEELMSENPDLARTADEVIESLRQ